MLNVPSGYLIYIDCLHLVITGEESVQSGNKDKRREKGRRKAIKGQEGNDKQEYERETRCLYQKVQEQRDERNRQSSPTCLLNPNFGMTRFNHNACEYRKYKHFKTHEKVTYVLMYPGE